MLCMRPSGSWKVYGEGDDFRWLSCEYGGNEIEGKEPWSVRVCNEPRTNMRIYSEKEFTIELLVGALLTEGIVAVHGAFSADELDDIHQSCQENISGAFAIRRQRLLTDNGPVFIFRDPSRVSRADARPLVYRKRNRPPRRHRQARRKV